MLQIGPYRIHSVETGRFALDGGAMFGVVPKPLWSRLHPADPMNRIEMHARVLLVQDGTRNILVDCGMGSKWSPRHREMYSIDDRQSSLDSGLAALGVSPPQITDVILTHLHFDHAGGLTRLAEGTAHTAVIPAFPNARIHLQRRNWEHAWNPNERDRGSYLKENFEIYREDKALEERLNLLSTSDNQRQEIFPGISVSLSHGHTPGMQVVRIAHAADALIYSADLVPTSAHVRLAWAAAYDLSPVVLLQEKKRLLEQACEEGAILFYEHCPRMMASRILRDSKGDFTHGESVSF